MRKHTKQSERTKTVRIPAGVHKRLKIEAASVGKTIEELVYSRLTQSNPTVPAN